MHKGGTNAGHYYAYMRPDLDDNWYNFDDEKVTKVDERQALKEQYGGAGDSSAYILVYVRESDLNKAICDVDESDVTITTPLKESEQSHHPPPSAGPSASAETGGSQPHTAPAGRGDTTPEASSEVDVVGFGSEDSGDSRDSTSCTGHRWMDNEVEEGAHRRQGDVLDSLEKASKMLRAHLAREWELDNAGRQPQKQQVAEAWSLYQAHLGLQDQQPAGCATNSGTVLQNNFPEDVLQLRVAFRGGQLGASYSIEVDDAAADKAFPHIQAGALTRQLLGQARDVSLGEGQLLSTVVEEVWARVGRLAALLEEIGSCRHAFPFLAKARCAPAPGGGGSVTLTFVDLFREVKVIITVPFDSTSRCQMDGRHRHVEVKYHGYGVGKQLELESVLGTVAGAETVTAVCCSVSKLIDSL